MLTLLEEFPDHITSLLRSFNNILISGDFNIPWNEQENPDTISMQEILDMHGLNLHIHTQTHKLGNTLNWFISNTATTIQDITNKDYLSDHRLEISFSKTVYQRSEPGHRINELQTDQQPIFLIHNIRKGRSNTTTKNILTINTTYLNTKVHIDKIFQWKQQY